MIELIRFFFFFFTLFLDVKCTCYRVKLVIRVQHTHIIRGCLRRRRRTIMGEGSIPVVGRRVGAAVDLLRGHVTVGDCEHALFFQHLVQCGPRPSDPATVRRQRRAHPSPGQRSGPQ